MSWRDRATVVPDAAPSGGDWRSRATPAPDAAPKSTLGEVFDSGAAFGRGFGQGVTAGFGDEIGAGLQSGLQQAANALPAGALDWAGIDNRYSQDAGDTYRQARDGNRAQLAQDEKEHGAASALGNIAGSVVLNAVVPGEGTYAQAVGLGAASGLGNSDADLTKGEVGGAARDMAIGGALGAAGKFAGDKVAKGAGAVRQWVLQRAGAGKAAAEELAQSIAARDVAKTVNSLRGEAGGAASRVGNIISNIEEINLPADAPRRTVGELRQSLQGQIAALEEDMAQAHAKALASGVSPEDVAAMRSGEFLSNGSKLDAAQQAAKKIQTYQGARDKLANEMQALHGLDEAMPLPDTAGPLREAQTALKADPNFLDVKQNVLKNALASFPDAADDAIAKRAALAQAMATQGGDTAARSQALLSRKAALERAKQLGLRYGLPALGGYLGSQIGGVEGAAVGAAAGAGARPGLQAVYRTATTNPAVQHAAFSALESLAKSAPQSFGKWSTSVAQAAARGPDALHALNHVLNQTDPEWRQMREKQEEDARR